jgi:putative ABC transport system permease protein
MQDVRYAIRRLRATPGFSAVALLVLALGIGANTAIFSLINTLYFKRLPLDGSDRLVHLYAHRPGRAYRAGFSDAEYDSVRARTHTLSPIAAETSIAQLHIVLNDVVREVRGDFVSANYFQTLNIGTSRGRFFAPVEDEVGGRNPVAVLGHRLSDELFGNEDRAVGASLKVNGIAVTVIGVAPREFVGDDVGRGADIWLPKAMLRPAGYGCAPTVQCVSIDTLVARLAAGQNVRTAQADAASTILWSRALDEHHDTRRELVAAAVAGTDPDTREILRPQMQLLGALTAVLLVIACSNLAGLLLAHALARRREIAVRLSIGATRARIVRQLLTEGLVLSAVGGASGLLVSRWVVPMLAGFYNVDSEGFLHSYNFEPDLRVYLYVFAVASATGVATAIVPALQSSRQDLSAALKEERSGAGPRGSHLRHLLVVAQIALSLVLAVSSSLLARSGLTLTRGTHFDPSGVAVLRIRPELARLPGPRAETFARDAASRLRRVPGVESVGMMIGGEGLVWDWASGSTLTVERAGVAPLTVATQDVDDAFFSTLRIPVLSGRTFTADDTSATLRVAVTNETLARVMWPHEEAIGRTLLVDGVPYRIVGTVADLQPPSAQAASAAPHLYRAFWQTSADAKTDVRMAVRVAGSPAAALPALRAAIRALDPAVPLGEDMTMSQQMALEYAPVLLARQVTIWCGAIALGLSAMGLYGVLALAMRSRTREIGIRIAIGAHPRVILLQFLALALRLGAAGIVMGIVAAWAATHLIGSWLYGVDTRDVVSYAEATAVLALAVAAAGYLPARRAARVDPLLALRGE